MTPEIELTDVTYAYPDGRQALRGVNLLVAPGESVGLIGPNGAGKSTLLLHLNGTLHDTGTVRIGGLLVERATLRTIRGKVGIVFQDPDDQLFSATVFDDVAFGPLNMGLPRDEVIARTERALVAVGMADAAQRAPYHLSVGEKRRVSIATVLSMSPEVMVFDEPTSNLDPRQRRQFIDLVGGLRTTKIIASHDLAMIARLCERVVLLNGGEVIADGRTETVLVDKTLMECNGLETVIFGRR